MLKISIFLLVVFILFFILLFKFLYSENKKEEEKDSILLLVFGAGSFSLIFTIVIALFLFIIIGSVSVIDLLLLLNISKQQLMMIGISFLIYLLTMDTIMELISEYLVGENIFHYIIVAFTRICAFYLMGLFISIQPDIVAIISIGVSAILLLLEVYIFTKKQRRHRRKSVKLAICFIIPSHIKYIFRIFDVLKLGEDLAL